MARRLISLLVLAVAGCPQPGARPVASPGTGAVGGLDRGTLERDLEAAILDSYEAMGAGLEEAYLDSLAHDARLLVLDIAPADVLGAFARRALEFLRRLDGDRTSVVSKTLQLHLARDGRTAWTFDELSYRVEREGRRVFVPLRATGVWEHDGARWQQVLSHTSYGISDELAFSGGFDATLPSLGRQRISGPVAQQVAQILYALLRGDEGASDRNVSRDADALVLGSDPRRELRGLEIGAAGTLHGLYGGALAIGVGSLRVHVSRGDSVAWAAANLSLERAGGSPVSARATFVLERRDGVWQVVQTHVAVPVSRELFERLALGEQLFGR